MRILIVPGAAVRSYVQPAATALVAAELSAELLPAPGEPGADADLAEYGRTLGLRLSAEAPVDLLIGLSVGCQAAAVAASLVSVRGLLLISPTVDPAARTYPRLLTRWLTGGRVEPPGLMSEQAPDWRRAGVRRLIRVVRSALAVRVEDRLPEHDGALSVVHAERDVITSHQYAAELAANHRGRLIVLPGGTHSWPYGDAARFVDVVRQVLT